MATYGYVAIDKSGKEVKSSMEGDNEAAVSSLLKKQGLIPLEIKPQNALTRDINIDIGGKVTSRDLSVMCRQFVSMVKAGVTILESLKLLGDQTENKKLQKAMKEVRASVEKGETLANSLAVHKKIFPNIMVTTIAAGESSGSLEIALERMSTHFEKAAKTKALVKKAMIYPVVVASVALIVVIVMLVVVIPNYATMFEGMGTTLPGITVAVLNASNFIRAYWYILFPSLIAGIIALKYFVSTPAGQLTVGRLVLKLPITKGFVVKSASSSLARTLSTLLAAGVPLIEAVEITANTMDNVLFKNALMEAKEEITRGVPLSTPLEMCGLFPPMVYHMIRIGEEAGSTEDMLDKLADYYDEEVEMATQSMMAAMEPLIIIVLAVIVGVLVGACMAPMLKMYTALDGL